MLKTFRDNLKHLKWVLWIVIAAFIIFFIPDFVLNQGGANAAATVGNERVSIQELSNTARQIEDFYRQRFGQQLDVSTLAPQIRRQALSQLIDQKVLALEAREAGFAVGDEELRETITSLPVFQGEGGRFVGGEIYRSFVRNQLGLTVDQFEEGLREDLLIQKLQAALASSTYVSESEVEQAYREGVERAQIRYLQVPGERFAAEVSVADQEIADWFESHRDRYRLPERRDVAYLLVDANEMRNSAEVDEAELTAYYQGNQDQFSRPEQVRVRQIFLRTDQRAPEEARATLEQARRRIEGGESFADVAREVSEDPTSAERGGELGFVGRGQMPPEFEEAAFAAPVGQLVGPVEAGFGMHLLEVTERREGGVQPFAEVQSQVRARLLAERLPELVEQKAQAIARRIEEEGITTPEQLEALADGDDAVAYAAPGPISQQDVIPGLGRPQELMDAAFALEEPGDVSAPVSVPRGQAVVLLKEVLPERDQELEEVRDAVRQEIARRRQTERAVERLAEAKGALEGGQSLEELAQELEVQVQESQEFGPRGVIPGLGYNPKLARAAMEMEEGEVGGPFESADGAILFEVARRTTWDEQQFEADKGDVRTGLEAEKVNRLLSSLVRQRRSEMDVWINPAILEEGETAAGV